MGEIQSTASAAVAGTAELVEMILMVLPLPDVLLAQRVDKTWHGVIQNSPTLQRALFLRSTSASPIRCICQSATVLDCATSDSCERLVEEVSEFEDDNARWVGDGDGTLNHKNVIINPMVSARLPWLLGELIHYRGGDTKSVTDIDGAAIIENNVQAGRKRGNDVKASFKHDIKIQRPEASWRNMLLLQPPASEVAVDFTVAHHWHRVVAQGGAAGVTLGDLDRRCQGYGMEICDILGATGGLRVIGTLTYPRPMTLTAADVLAEVASISEREHDYIWDSDPERIEPS